MNVLSNFMPNRDSENTKRVNIVTTTDILLSLHEGTNGLNPDK